MARFKLLAGTHIQADPDWEPTEEDKELAKNAGRTLKAPSRVYRKGDTVESDKDLVALHGHQKFQLLGESRTKKNKQGEDVPVVSRTRGDGPAANPTVAPGGQVGSGFQQTTGLDKESDPEGRSQVSGPMTPAEAKAAGGEPDAPLAEAEGDDGNEDADDGGDATGEEADLETMTVAELRDLADTEEIDLKGAARKDDIVKAIRKGRKAR